jgi:Tfp pilus assembly protein PilN
MRPVEFLPERIRFQRARRRRLTRQGCLLGACILAMAALTAIRQGRIASAKADLVTLESRLVNTQGQLAMIAPLEQQMADLLIKKRIDEELGSRTDCTAVLAELCHLMPANLSLVALELKTVDVGEGAAHAGAAAPAGPGSDNPRRVRLVITGMAPSDVDVANFIGQMSASPLFDEVNMGYVKTVPYRGRSGREFQAGCYLTK